MIKKIWNKLVNWETISYTVFGVLTTLVDWGVYTILRMNATEYMAAQVASWCAAVAFAFVTNKIWVFKSYDIHPDHLIKEMASFVACRLLTGVVTLVGMMIMVDIMGVNDYISKLVISVLVIILNYVFSKIFIFKQRSFEER